MTWSIAILTSSDMGSKGLRADESGVLLREGLKKVGCVQETAVLPDDDDVLRAQLARWISEDYALVATTGGTGLGPRDVMPEVTRSLIEREVPGVAEAMRAASMQHTPFGMLSRGIVGVAGRTLIINFPGSPKAIRELLPVVLPVIPHALDLLHGDTGHGPS